MKIGFLITARLKSSRLKFKLLKDLNGYTVIERIINRAKVVSNCSDIVLCTSKNTQDLPLVRLAKENNIYCFNGHADDVLKRLLDAALLFEMDYFIGITADNPLFSIRYANKIAEMIHTDPTIDYIYSSGNPVGTNMYALKTKALELICGVKEQVDTEIWGRLINRPELFNVVEVPVDDADLINIERLTIDEEDDYKLINKIFSCFDKDAMIEERDIEDLINKNPEFKKINAHVVQRDIDNRTKNEIDDFFRKNLKLLLQKKELIYAK